MRWEPTSSPPDDGDVEDAVGQLLELLAREESVQVERLRRLSDLPKRLFDGAVRSLWADGLLAAELAAEDDGTRTVLRLTAEGRSWVTRG